MYKKIINPNLSHKGIKKTKKQLEASRKSGLKVTLTKNPMKRRECVEKNRLKQIGRKNQQTTLRNILDNPMKNPESVEKVKRKLTGKKNPKSSMRKLGKPLPHLKEYQFTSAKMILNNPMKNPESAKKNAELRQLNFPEETLKKIIHEYKTKSLDKLSKEYGCDRGSLSKLLKRKGVKINKNKIIEKEVNNEENTFISSSPAIPN
jgi:hypothetical protein